MTRVCWVVQCGTKSGSQENCLFEINYDTALNAVGPNLKQSKTPPKRIFICKLHFADECIIQTDTKIMKDGSQVLVPRKRPRLKKNSIPTIFPNQTQNRERIAFAAINKKKRLPSSSSTKNKGYIRRKTTNTGDQYGLPPGKLVAESRENSLKETRPTIDRQETMNTGNLFDTPPESRETYTQKHLIEDWRAISDDGKTPSQWELGISSHGLFFVYFGDDHKSTSRTILVKEDMSLEICHYGRLANLPVLERLRSFQDFFGVLNTVTSSRICEGVPNIPCKNVFFVPKLRSKSDKCTDCRKISKQLRDIVRKREKRALLKQKKDKSFVPNLKRKYKLAVNKISNQAAEVEQLMQKSSITNQTMLENVIKEEKIIIIIED